MKNKYGAKKTIGADGRTYDSKLEAKRAYELQMMEKAGEICDLCYQVPYYLDVKGVHVCKYIADFTYWKIAGSEHVVEDCKGVRTAVFNLKAKLFKAVNGYEISIYPPKRRKKNAKKIIKKISK